MQPYNPKEIEPKWQKIWDEQKLYRATEDADTKKFYALVEFPFPSGDGIHMGHVRPYTGMDIVSRKRRMQGENVMYPIGWDAFGLPTENYAIKTGRQPADITRENTDNFRRQLKALGFSFDWEREVNTSDPAYYRWTQWIFLQLLKKGLAYKAKMTINWCPKDKIGLANEEAAGGVCDRCGGPTEKREKEQWMLAITKYADRLDADLDTVNYLEKIIAAERNWIGRSGGHQIKFEVLNSKHHIEVFTTRIDTLFGVTYLVLAPEHPLLQTLWDTIENKDEVRAYIDAAKTKQDIERTAEEKDKTGIQLKGISAVNPAHGETIPVWIADYVLGHYGTGAVMAVPAHDERDFAFAQKYGLPVTHVIMPSLVDHSNPLQEGKEHTFRKMVLAIVYNPKTDKYLVLKWKDLGWTGFITGGVEKNENSIEAAKREIQEETGYANVSFVRSLGMTEAHFFAKHKDVNRTAHAEHLLFALNDEQKVSVGEAEAAQYEATWMSLAELKSIHLQHAEAPLLLERLQSKEFCFTGEGVLFNSDEFSDLLSGDAREKIAAKVSAEKKTTYKLRDWVFSRQRYWGEPIPVVHCALDGTVPLDESELPLTLPPVEKYQPTDTGESPLAAIDEWVNTLCPLCGGPAKRETDTMPNWAGSSWYYLRYADPHNDTNFADRRKLDYWTPVDWYNGGMEHATLHLLYSRFWHKFLYDLELVPSIEPYKKRTAHGLVLAENGEKMSKSKGNVINPDDFISRYSADAVRVYSAFMGPFDQAIAWNADSLAGAYRFIERVWALQEKALKKDTAASKIEVEILLNQTIKKVSEDIEGMKFNTAISSLMILTNALLAETSIPVNVYEVFLKLLAPFAPHVTEELWQAHGNTGSIHREPWPSYDPSKLESDTVRLVVQINSKVRGHVDISRTCTEDEIMATVKADPAISKWLGEGKPKKVVFVPGRLINIVM